MVCTVQKSCMFSYWHNYISTFIKQSISLVLLNEWFETKTCENGLGGYALRHRIIFFSKRRPIRNYIHQLSSSREVKPSMVKVRQCSTRIILKKKEICGITRNSAFWRIPKIWETMLTENEALKRISKAFFLKWPSF